MPRIFKLLVPVAIMTAVSLNGALTVAGWEPTSNLDENRDLAAAPSWTGSIDGYVRALDAWITDNFALRKPLVSAFNEFLYENFRSTLAPKVVVGEGPWIFGAEFDGQRSVAPRQLSQDYIAKVKQALIERKAWLKARGIEMIVMFMPTKTAIYGNEYLPEAWHFDQNQPTESEQVYAALKDLMPESLVPVRDAMMEADGSPNLYYHTDPHATQWGTFVAFQQLTAHIEKHFPNKAPSSFPPYSLKVDYYEPTAYGRLMGLPFREESWVPVPDGEYKATSPTPPSWSALIPAGGRLTYYENSHVREIKAALIGDSFTNRMSAIFGEVFSQAATLNVNNVSNHPADRFPVAFLDAYRPDFAVFTYVESRLVECSTVCSGFPVENPEEVRNAGTQITAFR